MATTTPDTKLVTMVTAVGADPSMTGPGRGGPHIHMGHSGKGAPGGPTAPKGKYHWHVVVDGLSKYLKLIKI